jgi:hypothetical protein
VIFIAFSFNFNAVMSGRDGFTIDSDMIIPRPAARFNERVRSPANKKAPALAGALVHFLIRRSYAAC